MLNSLKQHFRCFIASYRASVFSCCFIAKGFYKFYFCRSWRKHTLCKPDLTSLCMSWESGGRSLIGAATLKVLETHESSTHSVYRKELTQKKRTHLVPANALDICLGCVFFVEHTMQRGMCEMGVEERRKGTWKGHLTPLPRIQTTGEKRKKKLRLSRGKLPLYFDDSNDNKKTFPEHWSWLPMLLATM